MKISRLEVFVLGDGPEIDPDKGGVEPLACIRMLGARHCGNEVIDVVFFDVTAFSVVGLVTAFSVVGLVTAFSVVSVVSIRADLAARSLHGPGSRVDDGNGFIPIAV